MKNLILFLFISLVMVSSTYAVKPQSYKSGGSITTRVIPVSTAKKAPLKHGFFYNITHKIHRWVTHISKDKAKNAMLFAFIAHLGWLGLLIAFILNRNTNYPLTNFYLRQLLGLYLVQTIINGLLGIILQIVFFASLFTSFAFANYIIIGIYIIQLFFLVLWIFSLIGALQRKEKPIPIFGKRFQEWFKNI